LHLKNGAILPIWSLPLIPLRSFEQLQAVAEDAYRQLCDDRINQKQFDGMMSAVEAESAKLREAATTRRAKQLAMAGAPETLARRVGGYPYAAAAIGVRLSVDRTADRMISMSPDRAAVRSSVTRVGG
jgi:hypothetical protein